MAVQRVVQGGHAAGPIEVVTGAESEPLRGRALWTSLAGLLVAGGVSFGLPLNDQQQAIVASLLAITLGGLSPQVVAWWARRHVNSPATMSKVLSRQG